MTKTLHTTRLFRAAKRTANSAPFLRAPLKAVNRMIGADDWTFNGWKMRTCHALPWDDAHDWGAFRKALVDVHTLSTRRELPDPLDEYQWRYWNLAFAVRH